MATIAVIFLIGAPSGRIQLSGVIAALVSTFAWFAATLGYFAFAQHLSRLQLISGGALFVGVFLVVQKSEKLQPANPVKCLCE